MPPILTLDKIPPGMALWYEEPKTGAQGMIWKNGGCWSLKGSAASGTMSGGQAAELIAKITNPVGPFNYRIGRIEAP